MAHVNKCIYCGRFFNPRKGAGDHIIPAAFGEFKDALPFRGCCQRCNHRLGPFEQLLVQSAPEGYLRTFAKPNLRRRNNSSLRQRGAKGGKAPRHIIWMNGSSRLVEPSEDDPYNVNPVDQVTITDESGGEFHVRLFKGMTPQKLAADIKRAGCGSAHRVYCNCAPENSDEYKALLGKVFPGLSELRWVEFEAALSLLMVFGVIGMSTNRNERITTPDSLNKRD